MLIKKRNNFIKGTWQKVHEGKPLKVYLFSGNLSMEKTVFPLFFHRSTLLPPRARALPTPPFFSPHINGKMFLHALRAYL